MYRKAGLFLYLFMIWFPQQAMSQEEVMPPFSSDMLPCEGRCAVVTRNPRRISGPSIPMPQQGPLSGQRYVNTTNGDGYLELYFTILPDGRVADDITVLRLLGTPDFAEAAKRAVRNWVYEPATLDGEAVAVSHRVRVIFYATGADGARPSFTATYNAAATLIQEGKLEEARDTLRQTFKLPSINFYERGMTAYLLATIAMERKDFLEARREAMFARMIAAPLTLAASRTLMRYEILASLQLGDLVAATGSLDTYKNLRFFDADDPIIKTVEDMRKSAGRHARLCHHGTDSRHRRCRGV